ncbi:hypothetical protein CVIRNUC_001631 [Coccomyxa viridis]|uniref:Uncharacterized protein n=1 Tax=Coccomyxa viridis TaxID=1274662 RepID=A0AAV1HV36_9CHLO|nr:hypothetical protein CVIRNUC_001631 [Coccomyxa viridis]
MTVSRCFLALMLMLCSTSLAVCGLLKTSTGAAATRLTMTTKANWLAKALHNMDTDDIKATNSGPSLRMRRLSAAAAPLPPVEYTPTWALPSLDPMQMARNLGHGLAAATNSLGTSLMGGLAGQALPPVSGNQQSSQVDQLADMVSAVFMVHSATQLDIYDHLNTSHAITAAELAVDLFWKQVEGYVNGTFDLIKDLPIEVSGLPKNVSDAVASQQQSLSQADNSTYLMESFHKLVHDLEEPLGISGGGSVFSYSPCFVNAPPAGINIGATGINVGAPLVGISPTGISINPTALNIQPTLISVSPTGVNVSPQGLNIAPALIAVAPGRVSVNPQGANIGVSLDCSAAAHRMSCFHNLHELVALHLQSCYLHRAGV